MFYDFLTVNRDEIIARTKRQATQRMASRPTESALTNGIPLFLSQLVEALYLSGASTEEIKVSATLHGKDRLRMGLTVSQVIHCYGDLCPLSSETPIERAWDWGSRLAVVPSRRAAANCGCGTCPARAASSPSTCPGIRPW